MTERPSAFALDRRGFIRLAGTTAAGWIALGATSDRMRIVASLTGLPLDDELTRRSMTDSPTSRLGGLIVGLRQRGWVEGVNFRLELRSSFGGPDKLQDRGPGVARAQAGRDPDRLDGRNRRSHCRHQNHPDRFRDRQRSRRQRLRRKPRPSRRQRHRLHQQHRRNGRQMASAHQGGGAGSRARRRPFQPGDHAARRALLPRTRSSRKLRPSGVSVVPAAGQRANGHRRNRSARFSEPPKAATDCAGRQLPRGQPSGGRRGGGEVSRAHDLSVPLFHGCGRTDELRADAGGALGRIRRSHPARHQGRRSAGAIAAEIRTPDQPHGRPRARTEHSRSRCWRAPTRSASERGDRPGTFADAPAAGCSANISTRSSPSPLPRSPSTPASTSGSPIASRSSFSRRPSASRQQARRSRSASSSARSRAKSDGSRACLRSCRATKTAPERHPAAAPLAARSPKLPQLDAQGREQVRVSRRVADRIGSKADLSASPAFRGANESRAYYGPVYFFGDTEPFMTHRHARDRTERQCRSSPRSICASSGTSSPGSRSATPARPMWSTAWAC